MADAGASATAAPKTGEFQVNSRGIPCAPFSENVAGLLGASTAEDVLTKHQEVMSKYNYVVSRYTSRLNVLKTKVKEIQNSLDAIRVLKEQRDSGSNEEIKLDFEIQQTLYARALVPPTNKVCIWIGADTLLEYTLEEAEDMLSGKLKTAKESIKQLTEDIEFIQEQITLTEILLASTTTMFAKKD